MATIKVLVDDVFVSVAVETLTGDGVDNTDPFNPAISFPGPSDIGAEDVANKSTDVNADQASNTKYPSVKAVYDWAVGLFSQIGHTHAGEDAALQAKSLISLGF